MCVSTLLKSYINDAARSFRLFQFVAQTAGFEKGIYIEIVSSVGVSANLTFSFTQ